MSDQLTGDNHYQEPVNDSLNVHTDLDLSPSEDRNGTSVTNQKISENEQTSDSNLHLFVCFL